MMKQIQGFGSDDNNLYNAETDCISYIKTSDCDNYLFTGDAAGRIVIFRKKKILKSQVWEPIMQYDGVEKEMDYLTSVSTNNKITGIIPLQNNDYYLYNIVSDTKNIYLHKLKNNRIKNDSSIFEIKMDTNKLCKHKYVRGHNYYINSIGMTNDREYILSSDDLIVNMWNINRPNKALPIIDTSPANLSMVNSTITKMKMDPNNSNILYTSASNGITSMYDTRLNCISYCPSKMMYSSKMLSYDSAEQLQGNIFNKKKNLSQFNCISDFDISNDTNYIVTRSPLFINVWDMRNTLQPCHYFPIHKHIYSFLKENYDLSFENFNIKYSNDNKYIYSGSFNNIISIDTSDYSISYMNMMKDLNITLDSPKYTCIQPDIDNKYLFASYNGVLNIYTT